MQLIQFPLASFGPCGSTYALPPTRLDERIKEMRSTTFAWERGSVARVAYAIQTGIGSALLEASAQAVGMIADLYTNLTSPPIKRLTGEACPHLFSLERLAARICRLIASLVLASATVASLPVVVSSPRFVVDLYDAVGCRVVVRKGPPPSTVWRRIRKTAHHAKAKAEAYPVVGSIVRHPLLTTALATVALIGSLEALSRWRGPSAAGTHHLPTPTTVESPTQTAVESPSPIPEPVSSQDETGIKEFSSPRGGMARAWSWLGHFHPVDRPEQAGYAILALAGSLISFSYLVRCCRGETNQLRDSYGPFGYGPKKKRTSFWPFSEGQWRDSAVVNQGISFSAPLVDVSKESGKSHTPFNEKEQREPSSLPPAPNPSPRPFLPSEGEKNPQTEEQGERDRPSQVAQRTQTTDEPAPQVGPKIEKQPASDQQDKGQQEASPTPQSL